MIVEAILTALFAVISLIVSLFNFPQLPVDFIDVYHEIFGIISQGLGFVFWVFDGNLLKTTISLIIGLIAVEKTIDMVLWVWKMIHGSPVADSE